MEQFICYAIGVLMGAIVTNIIHYRTTSMGTLSIDQSNPEKYIYRIELDKLDIVSKKKHIYLKVDPKADLSQK